MGRVLLAAMLLFSTGCATDEGGRRYAAMSPAEQDPYLRCESYMMATCRAVERRASKGNANTGICFGIFSQFATGRGGFEKGQEVTCVRQLRSEYALVAPAGRPQWLAQNGCPSAVAGVRQWRYHDDDDDDDDEKVVERKKKPKPKESAPRTDTWSGFERPDGAELGRCYGNGTCNQGLDCVEAICIRKSADETTAPEPSEDPSAVDD